MIELENLSRRFHEVGDKYVSSLKQISDNEVVVNGPFVREVETRLTQMSGRKYVALVRSGSHAISIALLSHVQKDKEVIVPNYSCPATLSSVVVAGFTPRFVEVNKYGSMDADRLAEKIDGNVGAVLATGLYGDVHDHDKIKKICDQHKIVYINDAAQSAWATYKGTNSLLLGDVVCISFADNKPIPTMGTFGAVFTDNEEKYNMIRALRKNGKPSRAEKYVCAGYSSHPEEDKAAQILAAMEHFEKWQSRKQAIADMYDEAFIRAGVEVRPRPEYSVTNNHKYAIAVQDKFETYKVLKAQGVETARHYVDNFAELEWTPNTDEKFPMTDRFIQTSLSLPINPHMTDKEVATVIDLVINNHVAPSS